MHPFFICNKDQIDAKLKKLVKVGTAADGWTHYYRDDYTKEQWIFTTYKSEFHGGGIPVLKRIPKLTIDELIEVALSSTDRNDIIGASLELSERERNDKEDFRQKLLQRILGIDLSNLTEFDKERIALIIYKSDLHDATNRKEIVGKTIAEIQDDATYYRSAAENAKKILKNIDKYGS
jgi:immunity protein 27 of polymorphic toxin system